MDYKNVTVVSSKGQNIYPSCKMYQGDLNVKDNYIGGTEHHVVTHWE